MKNFKLVLLAVTASTLLGLSPSAQAGAGDIHDHTQWAPSIRVGGRMTKRQKIDAHNSGFQTIKTPQYGNCFGCDKTYNAHRQSMNDRAHQAYWEKRHPGSSEGASSPQNQPLELSLDYLSKMSDKDLQNLMASPGVSDHTASLAERMYNSRHPQAKMKELTPQDMDTVAPLTLRTVSADTSGH